MHLQQKVGCHQVWGISVKKRYIRSQKVKIEFLKKASNHKYVHSCMPVLVYAIHKHHSVMVNIFSMHSGDLRFKFRPERFSTLQANAMVEFWPQHQLPYQRLLMVFVSLSSQILIQHHRSEHYCFLSNPFLFVI